MKIKYHGKNVEVTESMKQHIVKKVAGLEKYVKGKEAELTVTAKIEKEKQVAEFKMNVNGQSYMATSKEKDFYEAVQESIDKLKRELKSDKRKGVDTKSHIKKEKPEEIDDSEDL